MLLDLGQPAQSSQDELSQSCLLLVNFLYVQGPVYLMVELVVNVFGNWRLVSYSCNLGYIRCTKGNILPKTDSIETGPPVESEIVRVVYLNTTEITEITRFKKNRTSGSEYLKYLYNILYRSIEWLVCYHASRGCIEPPFIRACLIYFLS